jgi:rhamnose utilization protein RhaD (predicted bifunctional aldolase and dehydrogenase)
LNRWTLHTHSMGVNILACQSNWDSLLRERVPAALCVPYATPGIRLGIAILAKLESYVEEHGNLPGVLFLQNHGLIITAENLHELARRLDAVEEATRQVDEKIIVSIHPAPEPEAIGVSLARLDCQRQWYRIHCPVILETLQSEPHLLFQRPFSPDGVTFCGPRVMTLRTRAELADSTESREYHQEFGVAPKVACVGEEVFVLADDGRKARDIQDVFRFQLLVISAAGEDYQPLDDEEARYLTRWEAELYRQNV